MKTKFSTDGQGRVTIVYDDSERTFTCPETGGYVREILDNGSAPQTCKYLGYRGVTLICKSRADLLDLIRREYRAMRRKEQSF